MNGPPPDPICTTSPPWTPEFATMSRADWPRAVVASIRRTNVNTILMVSFRQNEKAYSFAESSSNRSRIELPWPLSMKPPGKTTGRSVTSSVIGCDVASRFQPRRWQLRESSHQPHRP